MHSLWKIHSELNSCSDIEESKIAKNRQELEQDENCNFSCLVKKEIDLYQNILINSCEAKKEK